MDYDYVRLLIKGGSNLSAALINVITVQILLGKGAYLDSYFKIRTPLVKYFYSSANCNWLGKGDYQMVPPNYAHAETMMVVTSLILKALVVKCQLRFGTMRLSHFA